MLSFLSSLFSPADRSSGALDKALIDAAIERIVDATDPRLRAFSNYRKRLYPGAKRSVEHIQALVGDLPEPVEISRRSFGTDPRLRAFFASPDRLQQVVGNAPSLVEFLTNHRGPHPDYIYGLLAPQMRKRETLGMELRGDQVKKDVLQDVVDFSDHRFVGAAGSDGEARDGIKKRGFDYLAELALRSIVDREEKKSELERKKGLLERKLKAMQLGNWGLDEVPLTGAGDNPDHRSLGEQISQVEDELMKLPSSEASLESRFDCINAILEKPEEWLSVNRFDLHVDVMSLRMTNSADPSSKPLELTKFRSNFSWRRFPVEDHFHGCKFPPEGAWHADLMISSIFELDTSKGKSICGASPKLSSGVG